MGKMKAETLKKAILQYAMQGKLVKQNPNDEPASILLERIKIEKEQLIKDGKIKKEKPLPPITEDEIPYELPKGWEWVRLSEILNKICAGGDKPNNFTEFKTNKNIYPVIANGEKNDGILGYSDIPVIKEQSITVSGRGTIGFVCIREPDYIPIVRLLVLVPNKYIDIKFLKYLLTYLSENGQGTAVKQLTVPMLSPKVISLPPLAEQERIVERLEQILPLVEAYGKNEEKLSKLNSTLPNKIKQSILKYAMQGKLVEQNPSDEPASVLLKRIKAEKEQLIKEGKIKKAPPLSPITQDEIPFEIPSSWEWCRVNDIGIYKKGPFGSALTKKIFVPKGNDTVKVYEQKNAIQKDYTLGEYYISKEYYEKSMKGFTVSSGDIIVSCAGTIGETYVMPENIELGIINQALMRMTITKEIDLKYFLMYFDIILKRDSKTYSKGSAIKNIPPFEIFKPMLVPLPPLAEQQRIVDKVNKLMEFIETLANNNRLVKDSASNLLKSIEKKSLTEYYCKNSNTIDIKEKRAILSAKIISQLHEEQYFGAIKLEKIIYLCETHLKINLGGKYKQEAAGPHDAQARYEIEYILKNKKWFSIRKEQKNNIEVTKYTPLEKSNEISEIFNKVFSAEATVINNLLELFRGKNSDFCESVATLYAVWVNRLSNNLSCTDTDLIADFKAWSKQKARFYDSDLQDRILFMRRKNLIPDSNIK